ncbi:unnamed protein product [Miscanthus lutarioriparius]|uniref:F-box domain-containing protein n=1 Tax=Miscanthus lutarioriparius TaxID=422564 RepID=A0A811PZT3_9POAL|nr:unnamed protein product [Miscanthus lutarioriparius]
MPPPAALMDELVEEFLLRLPPDDPASLVNAALVCKRVGPPHRRPCLPPQVPQDPPHQAAAHGSGPGS